MENVSKKWLRRRSRLTPPHSRIDHPPEWQGQQFETDNHRSNKQGETHTYHWLVVNVCCCLWGGRLQLPSRVVHRSRSYSSYNPSYALHVIQQEGNQIWNRSCDSYYNYRRSQVQSQRSSSRDDITVYVAVKNPLIDRSKSQNCYTVRSETYSRVARDFWRNAILDQFDRTTHRVEVGAISLYFLAVSLGSKRDLKR